MLRTTINPPRTLEAIDEASDIPSMERDHVTRTSSSVDPPA